MRTKSQQINATVERAVSALSELKDLMANVDDIYFGSICDSLERLEFAVNYKTITDAAFAFIAERDDAGRRVGSTKAVDYLTARLHITRQEAFARIKAGNMLFAEEEETELDLGPGPEPEPEQTEADFSAAESEEARRRREEEDERRREEERRKAEEEARRRKEREAKKKEELRKKLLEEAARAANREKVQMIEQELRALVKYSQPGPNELRLQALDYAETHSLDDTRAWLRRLVGKANANAVTPRNKKDPYASTRKRELWISRPDQDGGCRIGGYLDAVTATLVKNALAPALQPGGPDLPPEEDTRTVNQRRHDQLAAIVANWSEEKASKHPSGGLGTIVISATVNQLKELSPDTLLPTTVGTMLSPNDLLRLGAAASDFLMITDDKQFKPLALGQGQRTASFFQRIALAAAYMVCTEPGCDKPARECDMHHMVAYSMGGPTDANNMSPVCRWDHVNINDYRDGRNNMGYIDRDPETGLVGKYHADGTFEVNETVGAQMGATRLLRNEVNGTAEHLTGKPWTPPDDGGGGGNPPPDKRQPERGQASVQHANDFEEHDNPPAWLFEEDDYYHVDEYHAYEPEDGAA